MQESDIRQSVGYIEIHSKEKFSYEITHGPPFLSFPPFLFITQ